MEISVINRLSDLVASLHRNPYAFSHLFPHHLSQLHNIWKWGAVTVILALLASFSTIVNRIRFFLVRFRQRSSLQLQQPLFDGDDFDSDDSDDSYSEPSDDEEEDEPSTSSRDRRSVDEDDYFRVRGSDSDYFRDDDQYWRSRKFTLGKRSTSIEDLLTWSERSVVNLWENLGLGFGFADDDDEYEDNNADLRKYGGSSSSPAVFLSAETRPSGRVSLSAWDRRQGEGSPVIIAEWKPRKPAEHIGAVDASAMETVYLTDDVTGSVTVGDMRKACAPLRS